MPDIAQTLFYRLNTVYPGIAFASIGIELVIVPLFICVWYIDGLRTYVQRDDRMSNAIWIWNFLKRYRALKEALKESWSQRSFRPSRTRTGLTEEGGAGNASELQPFTRAVSTDQANPTAENGPSAADGQSEPTTSNSQSSAVDWPSRSGTDTPVVSDPRRVNTT